LLKRRLKLKLNLRQINKQLRNRLLKKRNNTTKLKQNLKKLLLMQRLLRQRSKLRKFLPKKLLKIRRKL